MIKKLTNHYEFLLITITAFVIRIINLGKFDLWLDEGVVAECVHRGLKYVIGDSFTGEPTPPLYTSLLVFWVKIFGDSEFSFRFPSAVFGALSISLVYLTGKKYVSKQVAVLAALFAMGNPFYLAYSQEARVYSLFTFLSLCSVYYFPITLEWKDKKKYFLATLLVPWAHAYGVFLILAQNVFILIRFFSKELVNEKKEFIKTWIKFQASIILVASVWYLTFLITHEKYLSRFRWIQPITFLEILGLLQSYISHVGFVSNIVLLVSIVMFIFIFLKKIQINYSGLLLLFLWPLFSIAIPILIGKIWYPFFIGKYSIAASMVFILLILAPVDLLLKKSKKLFVVLLLLAGIISTWQISNYFRTAVKDEWKKAINIILFNEKEEKKAVVVLESYFEESSLDYYVRKMEIGNRIQVYYLKDFNQLRSLFKENKQIWFIQTENANPQGFNNDHSFIEERFSNPNDHLQLVKLKVQTTP